MSDKDNYTPDRRRLGTDQRPADNNRTGGSFDLRVDPKGGAAAADVRLKAERTAARPRSKGREALGWILSIGIAILAAFVIRALVFETVRVDGESMEPTLFTDQRLGVEKISRYMGLPKRGDIVIVQYPNLDDVCVKRTIGLPGETVEVYDSTVYINGVPLEEDYVSDEPYADMGPVVVPEDSIFVMGDNRAHSMDSRASYVGAIPRENIIGHGLFVMWPFDNMHMIDHAEFSDAATPQ